MDIKFSKRRFLKKSFLISLIISSLLFFSYESQGQSNKKESKKNKIENQENNKDYNGKNKNYESNWKAHNRDEGEKDKEGEEDGNQYFINEKYDEIKNGVRLILKYDEKSNSFIGIVKNTTSNELKKVRVEVHLSNGIELGPTTPVNLAPGKKKDIVLKATAAKFKTWSTHAEVGNRERESESGEHDGGKERNGEHKRNN